MWTLTQKVAFGISVVLAIVGIICLGVSSKYQDPKKKQLQIAGGVLLSVGVIGCAVIFWWIYRTKSDVPTVLISPKGPVLISEQNLYRVGDEEDNVFLRDCDTIMTKAPTGTRQRYNKARSSNKTKRDAIETCEEFITTFQH